MAEWLSGGGGCMAWGLAWRCASLLHTTCLGCAVQHTLQPHHALPLSSLPLPLMPHPCHPYHLCHPHELHPSHHPQHSHQSHPTPPPPPQALHNGRADAAAPSRNGTPAVPGESFPRVSSFDSRLLMAVDSIPRLMQALGDTDETRSHDRYDPSLAGGPMPPANNPAVSPMDEDDADGPRVRGALGRGDFASRFPFGRPSLLESLGNPPAGAGLGESDVEGEDAMYLGRPPVGPGSVLEGLGGSTRGEGALGEGDREERSVHGKRRGACWVWGVRCNAGCGAGIVAAR